METALVLGASGGIGGAVAGELVRTGWRVRALKRGQGVERHWQDGIEWLNGDAMLRADVLSAASGCGVIVHAVNPPGYRRWDQLVLPMIDNTIAAARQHGATVLLPGTVYNFGPDSYAHIEEDSPQQPLTRKGRIRVELEQRLQLAATTSDLRAIIVRAGDFFGPGARSSWLSQGMLTPGKPVARLLLPARHGVGHQFAYLPDVARTMVALLGRRADLPRFSRFNMAGHWDADGQQLARAIARVLLRHGLSRPKFKAFPWWLVWFGAAFNPTLREMLEMRYLWQTGVRMSNQRLLDVLGSEPHTPLDQAIEATLQGLGCLGST